jgi:hypothetical protein
MMPCSNVRKTQCIANDAECTWVVKKGCRKIADTIVTKLVNNKTATIHTDKDFYWVSADYLILRSYSGNPIEIGDASNMVKTFKAYVNGECEIVAIRDTYTYDFIEFYTTYGIPKKEARALQLYMKTCILNRCIVIKIKGNLFGAMKAYGKFVRSHRFLTKTNDQEAYFNAFAGFPVRMRVDRSDVLGSVAVAYYDIESG